MRTPLFHVDAFTDRPFAGNPAGVCLASEDREAAWMQSIASEMNLAETAFLQRREGHWDLRWFTPAVEVDLCGHATLASAHVLWEDGHLPPGAHRLASGRILHRQNVAGNHRRPRAGDDAGIDLTPMRARTLRAPQCQIHS